MTNERKENELTKDLLDELAGIGVESEPSVCPFTVRVSISGPLRVYTKGRKRRSLSDGERAVLDRLLRTQWTRLVGYLAGKVSRRQDAEDLAAQAVANVVRAMAAGAVWNPEALLWRAAKNLLANYYRDRTDEVSLEALRGAFDLLAARSHLDRQQRRELARLGVMLTTPCAYNAYCQTERRQAYVDGLADLPLAQLQDYGLVEIRGVREREVAEITGRHRGTVSVNRTRARLSLKAEYLLADAC